MKRGFTLIELLVVMAILSTVGIVVLTIFSRTLQGGNKSKIIGIIKQNGSSVLEGMDKVIRDAEDVVCPAKNNDCNTSQCKSLVVRKAGVYTRYRFTSGPIKQDNPAKQGVQGQNREETDPEFVNRICNSSDSLLPDARVLTDTNPKLGILVENSSFKRDTSAGFTDQVIIKFDLKVGTETQTFQTSVQLR